MQICRHDKSAHLRRKGFEPLTPWFVAKYSIQLSYRRLPERMGFEPMIRSLVYSLSRGAPSATRPSLLFSNRTIIAHTIFKCKLFFRVFSFFLIEIHQQTVWVIFTYFKNTLPKQSVCFYIYLISVCSFFFAFDNLAAHSIDFIIIFVAAGDKLDFIFCPAVIIIQSGFITISISCTDSGVI